MSVEATRDLSIPDLLRALNEKLGLECTRLRQTPVPPTVSATSLESEIESLETRARDILRFLPSLRNMLQPVNKLPPEIISHIAYCCKNKNAIDVRSTVPLTHVCRYWRESIISAPKNWTSISSYSMNLMVLSLERSKAAPLQLWLTMDHVKEDPGLCYLISPHIQHIETLQFHELTIIGDLTQTLPNFPQSMPNLQSLGLSRPEWDSEWDPSTDPFGSSQFPNTLRSLSLEGIPLYPPFLKLRTLTELFLYYYTAHPPLDTLLDFLEENPSLESVELQIVHEESPPQVSQDRSVVLNQLQRLSIACWNATIARTLITSIPLRKGVHLEIDFNDNTGDLVLNDILSGISTTHLSNLESPTFMEYQFHPPVIRLIGPNGSLSYNSVRAPTRPFEEIPFPLTNVKHLHLTLNGPSIAPHPSLFPALEALTVEGGTNIDISRLFSALFPHPSFFSSLKTLGFLDCIITEEFVEDLIQFASGRKRTISAWLRRVVIVHRDGMFPSADSIHRLEEHVPVVDVRFGKILPTELV